MPTDTEPFTPPVLPDLSDPPVDLSIWGKITDGSTGYPLLCHLLDAAAAAGVLWDSWLRPGLRELITSAIAPGCEADAKSVVMAIAGLHDIGKTNKVFQGQLFSTRTNAVFDGIRQRLADAGFDMSMPKPEIVGAHIAHEYKVVLRRHEAFAAYLLGPGWPIGDECVRDRWASTVAGGHHGRFHPYSSVGTRSPARPVAANRYLSQLTENRWGEQQRAHQNTVLSGVGVRQQDVEKPLRGAETSTVTLLLTGFVMLADWIASGAEAVRDAGTITVKPADHPADWIAERSRYFAEKVPLTLGVYQDMPNPVEAIMGEYAESMSPLQQAAQQVGRGLWIATETTGAGKTEAALLRHAAVPGEGIMFALPTRATTDAMFDRLGGYFGSSRNAASLLHAHRSLNTFYAAAPGHGSGMHSTSWLADSRNALFAPVSVGTCDQVLLGALKQKNTPVRLLALANRHVVVDEVHTFDHYQAALLEEMLAWWGRTDTRVTLLSASLPIAVLQRYGRAYAGRDDDISCKYPGHVTISSSSSSSSSSVAVAVRSQRTYTLQVDLHDTDSNNIVDTHVRLALQYRSESPNSRIAVVVNQVDRAIEVGRHLSESGFRTIVLHSRMAAGHRTQIARELHSAAGKGSHDRGFFVVGTQIIESSLDIDFDQMISDLAPAPSLIQRAGRLWRSTPVRGNIWGGHVNERPTSSPVLDVVVALSPDGELDPRTCLPYLPGELRRTRQALKGLAKNLNIPGSVQKLVDDALFDPFDPASWDPDVDNELVAAATKLAAATNVVVALHNKHGAAQVLRPEATIRDFTDVTSPDELAESSTRHVERPTFDGFLVDPTGSSRWVWRGDVATALHSRDVNIMRTVLGLTFPLPDQQNLDRFGVERIPGFDATDEAERARRGPLQRNLVPLRQTTTRYDDVLGLRRPQSGV